MRVKGSCLCRAVSFSFDLKNKDFDACHCSMCRQWGGGPALAVKSEGNIDFLGEEHITVYSSSAWAERGFCKFCGSHLFYRLKDKKHNFCNFQLGTIENNEDFKFVSQIYIDAKPANYSFSNETKRMTEKEILEDFGVSE
ncbi:MAG: GFA family protein [Bacteriovoracaceae bacterium]|nr:GFA family protein [Bacteriovoracaceae bacterium]